MSPTEFAPDSAQGYLIAGIIAEYQGMARAMLLHTACVAAFLHRPEVQALREEQPTTWQGLHQSLQNIGSAMMGYQSVFNPDAHERGLDRLRSVTGALGLQAATRQFFDHVEGCAFHFPADVLAAHPQLRAGLEAMGLEVDVLGVLEG